MAYGFFDDLSTQMYPTALLHKFGVNGKVSGSVGAVGEMQGVAAVLHGPRGCGFHYRNSARRRHQLFHPLYSSNLQEEDIIQGGCQKLFDTVVEVYRRHHPDLIAIIPTPISDILNDDIQGVAKRLREEHHIPVVAIKSELFSHRDKSYARRRVREIAKQPVNHAKNLEMELLGCGFTEALYALVDQVMEPQPVDQHRMNIETVGWGAQGKLVLREIEAFLLDCGIQVGTWIPSAPLEQLKQAPAARLNIVKRVRWAKYMKEKFGTDYLHLGGAGRHHGLEGIVCFYQDIAKAMGMESAVLPRVEQAKQCSLEQTRQAREYLGQFQCALVCRGLQMAPYILRQHLEDYGLNVTNLILMITHEEIRQLGLDDSVQEKLLQRVEEVKGCRNIQVQINPDTYRLKKLFSTVGFVVGTNDITMEGLGAPVIPAINDTASLSFESYVRSVLRLEQRVRDRKERKRLLLAEMGFQTQHYPLLPDKDSLASREMWHRMWLTRKDEER